MKKPKLLPSQTNGKSEVCNLENCFMFEEEESPKSKSSETSNSAANSRTMLQGPVSSEFRTDKPYRLALYVQPNVKRRINSSTIAVWENLSQMRRIRDKENISRVRNNKYSKTARQKMKVALFDEENENSPSEKNKVIHKKSRTEKEPACKGTKSILSYLNTNESLQKKQETSLDVSSLPKTKQKKIRKSYEKKFKEYTESEKITEPTSEEILKDIDIKKITRTKNKKPSKEEKEFEKWAENMNSAFDDIEKFELSINYD